MSISKYRFVYTPFNSLILFDIRFVSLFVIFILNEKYRNSNVPLRFCDVSSSVIISINSFPLNVYGTKRDAYGAAIYRDRRQGDGSASPTRRQELLPTPRDRNLIRTVLIMFSNSPNRFGQQLRGIKVFRGNRPEISSLMGSDFPPPRACHYGQPITNRCKLKSNRGSVSRDGTPAASISAILNDIGGMMDFSDKLLLLTRYVQLYN